ncbi:MAG: hypothetical protein CMJ58_19085 [Planctomycetaceae bacterium]|nr:hypothetical protein [Planctomycetaceae bacterium]
MTREFSVVIARESDWFVANVPELPWAVASGAKIEEARAAIREVVGNTLRAYVQQAINDLPSTAIWETITVDVPGRETSAN